jgi:hypothetical protein
MIPMENSKITSNCEKLNEFIYTKFQYGDLTNSDLVSFIILCFDLLQLRTVAQFAKFYGKTYRGVKNYSKNMIDINGNKYIIDNF